MIMYSEFCFMYTWMCAVINLKLPLLPLGYCFHIMFHALEL